MTTIMSFLITYKHVVVPPNEPNGNKCIDTYQTMEYMTPFIKFLNNSLTL